MKFNFNNMLHLAFMCDTLPKPLSDKYYVAIDDIDVLAKAIATTACLVKLSFQFSRYRHVDAELPLNHFSRI